ncbi:MAG: crossover junction endodeoxyribonuclease RuvC [Planctomycetota bacterium]|jgi:crossover junction endodeoxyribonuclease RuvC
MRILGIDPGLRICGYAVLEAGPAGHKLIEAGILRTSKDEAIESKLNQIAQDIRTVLKTFKPQVVAVEQLYSHYAHPRTAILMGHARGVILQKVAEASVEVRSFSATRIKKSVTGNGRASKEQMQRAIQGILSLPALPEPSDVADAIAAAVCCANSSVLVARAPGSAHARRASK